MDLVSRLLMEKKIGFEPQTFDPFTLENCAICGDSIEDKDLKVGMFICRKCNKTLAEVPAGFASSD